MDINPTLYSESLLLINSFLKILLISIPVKTAININNGIYISLSDARSILIDSGIRSVMDIVSITALANDKEEAIILLVFLKFIKIGNIPNNVTKPEIMVIKKAILVLLIYFHQ